MLSIPIIQEYRVLCQQFAEEVVDTNLDEYKRRKQFNRDKIIKDIYHGKICELALARTIGCSDPDFNIYSKRKKSFSADLSHKGFDIHIKSQHNSVSEKYGESWVFQQNDKLTTNPKESDIIAVAIISGSDVNFKGFYKAKSLVGIYKPPRLRHLYSKCCLYYDDIKEFDQELSLFD